MPMLPFEAPVGDMLTLLVISLVFYMVVGVIRRVWLSPLASIPGPRLAAATYWYEFYYDVILRGHYVFKLRELHEKYGPIIRVNPHELHINDPEFYGTMYSPANKPDKNGYYTRPFYFGQAAFGTLEHSLHRVRRSAMDSFFAHARVARHEQVVQARVQRLVQRMREWPGEGTEDEAGPVIPLTLGFSCLTTDVTADYVLGHSTSKAATTSASTPGVLLGSDLAHLAVGASTPEAIINTGTTIDLLGAPDWHPEWGRSLRSLATIIATTRQVNWLRALAKRVIPHKSASNASPGLNLLFALIERTRRRITESQIVERQREEKGQNAASLDEKTDKIARHSLVDQLISSPRLSELDKWPNRMELETRSVLVAGNEATTRALTVTNYHLLANPNVLARVRAELKAAEQTSMVDLTNNELPLRRLEQLPYLTAVVQEGLRLAYGISVRVSRKLPVPLVYRGYIIPPQTPVGASSLVIHHNESVFPDSHRFIPERWMDLEYRKTLSKYMVSFGKGTRHCIGEHLARAMLLITTAALARRFDLELAGTVPDDIEVAQDLFVPRARNPESAGLKVRVRNVLV